MSKPGDVWYISARAVREYLALVGRRDDDGGPEWARAEDELQAVGRRIVESGSQLGKLVRGSDDLRMYRGPLPHRHRLLVSTSPRPEGPLPQLVSVQPGTEQEKRRHGR